MQDNIVMQCLDKIYRTDSNDFNWIFDAYVIWIKFQ